MPPQSGRARARTALINARPLVPGPGVEAGAKTPSLFLALWPEAGVANTMRSRCVELSGNGEAHFVAAHNVHLTLHFLGSLPRWRLPELVAALQVPFRPFELVFGHYETWSHGLLVATPDQVPQALLTLHADLGQALVRLALPIDAREFRPHVTLARRWAAPLPVRDGPFLRWSIDRYTLVESRVMPQPAYHVLQDYRPGPHAGVPVTSP